MVFLIRHWYLIAIAAVGVVAGGLYVQTVLQGNAIDRLNADLAAALASVDACTDDLSAIIKDKINDEAAENLSGDDLRDLLSDWMRETPGGAPAD